MNAIYLRRRRKVYFSDRDAAVHLPVNVIATIQINIESLGFVLSPALADRLRTLAPERLASFYKSFIKDLQALVGAHREFKPMYPNFPDEVMGMTECELYWNAITHYFTHTLPEREKQTRPPLTWIDKLRVIDLGTKDDFDSIFTQLAGSKSSLSAQDKADAVWFIKGYGDAVARLLPPAIPFKENLAVVGAALLRHTGIAASVLDGHLKTATDVLRLAVAMSDGDVSLAKPTKFTAFRRRERKQLLAWLERTGDPTEDMLRWAERWKRLGERLHPGDYSEEYPRTLAAFQVLRDDLDYATFNGRVERGLLARDVEAVVGLLSQRPGDLARRLDHLVRTAAVPQAVIAAFEKVVDRVSTPVTLQVLTHFEHRSQRRPVRVVFPKGDVGKLQAITARLDPLPESVTAAIVACCRASLVRRFATRPGLGTCWLDPSLANYTVPFAQRSASKSLRSLSRGSRVRMPMGNCVRFFLWWKNGRSRTDLDLSAALYSGDGKFIEAVAYYNLKNFGGHHSGDIVDAPKGAAEFIDLDIERTVNAGVRYVIMSVNNYTEQPFCDLPECFAGWISRVSPGSGEIFEARTVQDKVDLAADTKICLPAILDLQAREVIWTDLALTKHPLWNNVENNRPGMGLMLQAMLNLVKPRLDTLFALHIEARGRRVEDKTQAETIFAADEGITPFDAPRILSEFL